MKKILIIVVGLLLTVTALAQAKTYYFQSGSSQPIIKASAATTSAKMARLPRAKRPLPFVICRDGARSYSRQNVCTDHGGIPKHKGLV